MDGVGAGVHEKVLIVLEGRVGERRHRAERRRRSTPPSSASWITWISLHERTGTSRARPRSRGASSRHGPANGIVRGFRCIFGKSHLPSGAASIRSRVPAPRRTIEPLLLKVHPGSEIDDGMCVIEPAVRCNHCGFCQSYGHSWSVHGEARRFWSPTNFRPAAIAKLEAVADVEVPRDGILPPDELRSAVEGQGRARLWLDLMKIDKAVIDAAPRLKVIANVAVGYNNIDVAYARSKNIIVTNTPDVLTDADGEHDDRADPCGRRGG